MPPDSWWGYADITRSGSANLTCSSSSITRWPPISTGSRGSERLRADDCRRCGSDRDWRARAATRSRSCDRATRHTRSVPGGEVSPVERHRPVDDVDSGREQTDDRQRGEALAAPRLADHDDRLAAVHGERHIGDERRVPLVVETDGQRTDVEQRVRPPTQAGRARRGRWLCSVLASATRRVGLRPPTRHAASPRRPNASTVRPIVTPARPAAMPNARSPGRRCRSSRPT